MMKRRTFLASVISAAGVCGSAPPSFATDNNNSASPTNPKFLYSFNARGNDAATYCDGLAFSRSGKHLAVVNSSSTYSAHPAFSVWDVETRQCLFRITGGENIPRMTGTHSPMWGKNDEWVTVGQPLSDGSLSCFDPQSGEVRRKINGIIGDVKINGDGTKLIYNNIGSGLHEPHLRVFDIDNNYYKEFNLIDCGRKFQILSTTFEWCRNDDIFVMGKGYLSKEQKCSGEDVNASLYVDQDIDRGYFIARLNLNDDSPRVVSDFQGRILTGGRAFTNYFSDEIFLPWSNILNVNTFESTPIDMGSNIYPASAAFSPKGDYLYVANSYGSPHGCIFDSKTGKLIGWFPAAKYQTAIAVSSDGKFMALAKDLNIELYRLL